MNNVLDVCLKKWNKEIVGHTTLSSRLLNLHQPKNVPTKSNINVILVFNCSLLVQDKLPEQCFKIFLNWAKCDHFYLFQRSKTERKVYLTPQLLYYVSIDKVYFMSSHNFCADITIHFRGKLINFICDKGIPLLYDIIKLIIIL